MSRLQSSFRQNPESVNPSPALTPGGRTPTMTPARFHRRDLLAFAFLVLLAPASARDEARPEAEEPKPLGDVVWTPVFEGIDRTEFRLEMPRLISAAALRIDLRAEGIAFLATPDNGEEPGETDGRKTTTFLKENRLQAAINAAPFAPVVNQEGEPMDVTGLHVSRGTVVSPPPARGYPALILTKSNTARIAGPPFGPLDDVWNAVGGFGIVLKDGEVIPGGADLHPRTAAGISADGRWLVWLVVDGRQRAHSRGATTAEAGEWLKALGCADGINLDGGGTATLVIGGKDGPQILNRPIHGGIPGNERPSGSHLGVTARPLDGD